MAKYQQMFKWLYRITNKRFHIEKEFSTEKDECFYNAVIIKDKIPDENLLNERDFIEVVYRNQSYWAIFKCPCGCKKVISLPLQKKHNPHWELKCSIEGKPTLYPSVWQNKGCLSHFWIVKGKIEWCSNTGIEPWIAEPMYYKKPIR